MNICVLIRVYNRIDDLENCVNIILKTWKFFNYHIIIVSNGKQKGYLIPDSLVQKVNLCIQLETNAGHMEGSSQLLMSGIKYIPEDTDFTIIIEADTWMYTDIIIANYIKLMKQKNAVWTSARWYDKFYSLATDFAIVQTNFLLGNPLIFQFKDYAECHVANYLMNNKKKFLYLKENMPTMVPSYIKKFPFASKGRFNIFIKSKTVTHHIEDLKGGLTEKKIYFNFVSNSKFFDVANLKHQRIKMLLLSFIFFIVKFFPRKSWVIKRYNYQNCIF